MGKAENLAKGDWRQEMMGGQDRLLGMREIAKDIMVALLEHTSMGKNLEIRSRSGGAMEFDEVTDRAVELYKAIYAAVDDPTPAAKE